MKIDNTPDTTTNHSAFQWIDQKVRRAVKRINIRLARYSMTMQIVILLIITVVLAFANAGILWKAIHSDTQIKIAVESIPFSSMKTHDQDSVLTQEEYNKLLVFNHLLDSLRHDPRSQVLYNQLMQLHPGIRDSINYLLKHYPPKK